MYQQNPQKIMLLACGIRMKSQIEDVPVVRGRERPYYRQTCFVTNAYRNFLESSGLPPPGVVPTALTTGRETQLPRL